MKTMNEYKGNPMNNTWKPKEGQTWWFVVFDEGLFKFEPCSEIYESNDNDTFDMPIFKSKNKCKAYCSKLNEAIRNVTI